MSLSKEEINQIAVSYYEEKLKDQKSHKFKLYENSVIEKLSCLVTMKTNRYKKFSNYPDLYQDGLEALVMALNTFRPEKGSFVWWASKYIGTRIHRSANAHSIIRVPMKKAKEQIPYKVGIIPEEITYETPEHFTNQQQLSEKMKLAMVDLNETQRKVVSMFFEFPGTKHHSIQEISENIGLSRPTCVKLINKSLEIIRRKLEWN
jgi:RNA polymerase sigma factor (sigma-70 family)